VTYLKKSPNLVTLLGRDLQFDLFEKITKSGHPALEGTSTLTYLTETSFKRKHVLETLNVV
jgi:hypothetical protein